MHVNRATFKIAEIVFAIEAVRDTPLSVDEVLQQFVCDEKPDIVIEIVDAPMPELQPDQEVVFKSQDTWALFSGNNQISLVLYHPYSTSEIERLIVTDKEFRRAKFYFRRFPGLKEVNPFDYPLGPIFMVCILSKNRGLMVHASGVDDRGRGYLFAGNSGQGKSTLSALWKDHGRVLNDDRMIVCRDGDGFRMYPTPWHGSFQYVSAPDVALDKVFLVSHGNSNRLLRRRPIEASCDLLARSFPPLWDADGMAFTLDFLNAMVQEISCYDLAFVPDEKLIDFLRCAK
jgi:hypothetical protein